MLSSATGSCQGNQLHRAYCFANSFSEGELNEGLACDGRVIIHIVEWLPGNVQRSDSGQRGCPDSIAGRLGAQG
ncbi:conserved protein of unknown function [Pseudomonas marincola]|uniref:Uncharacterized protein n=1 Tax=Pseudomonas marincola TaxID=437900 RepID=A0A653DYG0_9PSED|nr:conserved protein of unknown function [Pseudomonas marincola]